MITLSRRQISDWRYCDERQRREEAKESACHHGVCITQPCPGCEAEGYVRCGACRKLFVPEDGKRAYCNTYCRNVAAHRRERAREATQTMAQEGV